jgi:hypothetical protein
VFHSIVQWTGVLVALPVVAILGVTVVLAMGSYSVPRVNVHLMRLVYEDLARFLEHAPNLTRAELEATANAVAQLERRLAAVDYAALERDERQAEQVASAILSDLGTTTVLTEIRRQRSAQARLAMERLTRLIEGAGPRTVARRWSLWLGAGTARVRLAALRDVGAKAAVVLLRRAGSDVQDVGVVGLVLGILSWAIVSQYDGDFFVYIGSGVSLGAFVGLAITSIKTFTQVLAQSATAPRARIGAVTAAVVIVYVAGVQILVALKPSWSPFR